MGTSRFIYNKAIEYYSNTEIKNKLHWMKLYKDIISPSLPEWTNDVPYQVKKIAVKDAYITYSNAIKSFKKTKTISKLRFRSKKNSKQTIYIPKSAVKNNGIYHTLLGNIKYKENLPEILFDCRLTKYYNDYYLNTPINETIKISENQGRIVSIDPGVRTFATIFSEFISGKIGMEVQDRIFKLGLRCDSIISELTKSNSKRKKRLKFALNRLKMKIRSLVDELHNKTIRYLLNNFDYIIYPNFTPSNLVKKIKRKIRSKTVRNLLSLRFYEFSQKLIQKSKQEFKTVLRVSEAYTSKVASWSGEIVNNLGSRKEISSNGIKLDRDINGSRGIYLRSMVDTPLVS